MKLFKKETEVIEVTLKEWGEFRLVAARNPKAPIGIFYITDGKRSVPIPDPFIDVTKADITNYINNWALPEVEHSFLKVVFKKEHL